MHEPMTVHNENAPFADPEIINEACGPAYTRFCKFVHDNSDIEVFMHNCGAIRDIMPYICEWGIDAINPVQIACAGGAPRPFSPGERGRSNRT